MTLYLISHDQQTIGVHQAPESLGALEWFARNVHGYSMAHALEHEGYAVTEVEELDCRNVAPIIEAICTRAGVTMSAAFVPFSQSRNAKPRQGEKPWPSLNWRVTIAKGAHKLETDYSQGEGHAPAYRHADKPERSRMIAYELETGRRAAGVRWGHAPEAYGGRPLDAPRLGDVLQAVVRDADVLDANGFEDWASDLGYDSDSRTAEATYRACLETSLKLRGMLGPHLLEELRTVAAFN